MNPLESEYWDNHALQVVDPVNNVLIRDNLYKRRAQVSKLMEIDFLRCSVLEIGCGSGVILSILKTLYGPAINYQATDVSNVYVDFCTKNYGVPVQHADVRELPYDDDSFDYVIALDSLEHVQPDDREDGYREIDRVMKDNSCLILNIPLSKSLHDDEFDHQFTYLDFIHLLECTRSMLIGYDVYQAIYKNGAKPTHYAWATGERHLNGGGLI